MHGSCRNLWLNSPMKEIVLPMIFCYSVTFSST